MIKRFNLDYIHPGHTLHVRSNTFVGKTIRKVLSVRAKREGNPECWGNHDAPVVKVNGVLCSGDHEFPTAKLTLLTEYQRRMNLPPDHPEYSEVKVLAVKGAKDIDYRLAANYWLEHKLGRYYDVRAFPRLVLKNLFIDIFADDPGWEWADWCTQGTSDSWRMGTRFNPWEKLQPTPYTTEKRVGISFDDVTAKAITCT